VGHPSTYRLIRSLVAPNKPTDKFYADLVKIIGLHFNPKPSVVVQRFKFNSQSKHPGEMVSAFVTELRRLSEHCEFEDTLNAMLCDCLVYGISDVRMHRRMLTESDLWTRLCS